MIDKELRQRLDQWGFVFALYRDFVFVNGAPSAWSQAMEHRGRGVGNKPLSIELEALEIEGIVSQIAREKPIIAAALRGYFCGFGRRSVERYETAQELARVRFSRAVYFQMKNEGVESICRALSRKQPRDSAASMCM